MTKIQIKSEELTPFGGIFSIMEQFDSTLSSVIDSTLGLRCRSFGYQYSEIIRSHTSIFSADWSQYKTKKNDITRCFTTCYVGMSCGGRNSMSRH